MATPAEVQQFLDGWTRSWTDSPDKSRKIFHPEGGVLQPGSDQLFNPDVEGSMTDRLRQIAPDLKMRLLNWAEREDVLFAEWELSCTLGSRPLKLIGVNRFTLKGERALEARQFIDRLSLVEFVEPEREVTSLGALIAKAAAAKGDRSG